MIRYLRSLWIWAASAALIIVWVPVLGVIWAFDKELRLRTGRWFRRLGRMLSRVSPWRIRITGRELMDANQVYVIVSNHQSLADIPLLSHLRLDTKWLAKAELFRVPLVGWMMCEVFTTYLWTGRCPGRARAMLRCAKYLRQHCSVVFFPEGGRSPDGEVQPFNEGAFQLAIRERVPILPLVVKDRSGAAVEELGGAPGHPACVLEPVPIEGWGVKECAALRDAVR